MKRVAAGLMILGLTFLAPGIPGLPEIPGFAEQVIAAPAVNDQSGGALGVPTAAPARLAVMAPDAAASSGSALNVSDLFVLLLATLAVTLFLVRGWFRLDRAPRRPVALDPIAAIGLLIGMILIRNVGVAMAAWASGIQSAAEVDAPGLAKLAIGAFGAQAIGAIVYCIAQTRARSQSKLTATHIKAALIGAATLLLAWPVVQAAAAIAAWVLHAPETPIAHDTLRELVSGSIDPWWIVLAVLVIAVAPLLEEVMYRGLLQSALIHAGLNRWLAITITSALFALMHWNAVEPPALAALFVLSLAMGWVYEKTGRLTASITMHMLFNAANLGFAMMMT